MRKAFFSILIIFLTFYFLLISGEMKTIYAANSTVVSQKKAIIIVLDRINLEDLDGDYPHIHQLINQGALGLMNIRSAGRYRPASSYLTIGAGTRGVAPDDGEMILSSDETYQGQKASKVYKNFTGNQGNPHNIFVLNINEILLANREQEFEIIPGLLGETLKDQGIPVTLLGNADTFKRKARLGGLIAMDARGIVAKGKVGKELLVKDEDAPFFMRTNYAKLYQEFLKYQDTGGLLVLELGDTTRADNYLDYITEERYQDYRRKALEDADQFIGKISRQLDFTQDLLMLVTPFPSAKGYHARNLLTPFIFNGPQVEKGLALSPTTRRPGVVANIDIAPTILSYYKVAVPAIMLGQEIKSQRAQETLNFLLQTNKQLVSTYTQRAYLIKPYVALQIFISLNFLLLVFFRKKWLKYIRPFICAGMAIPFVFLILAKVAGNGLWSKYLWLIMLTVLVVLVGEKLKNTLSSIIFITLITAGGILLDLVWGAPLMQVSVLGYDPIGGSRYYGLGNEYMGVLIGSLIIGLMTTLDKTKKKQKFSYAIPFIFAIAFYLILSPSFGSNVGGTISAFGAFLTTMFMVYGIKLKLKHVFFIVGGILVTLIILFLVIAPLSPPSHISETVEVIKAGGLKSIFIIFSRKLAMNYKLFKYTVWTRGLLTFIGVIAALLYRPPYRLKIIFQNYNNFYYGTIGTGVGCLLALCFNDSGIVAAATMMIYITLPVLLLVTDEV